MCNLFVVVAAVFAVVVAAIVAAVVAAAVALFVSFSWQSNFSTHPFFNKKLDCQRG